MALQDTSIRLWVLLLAVLVSCLLVDAVEVDIHATGVKCDITLQRRLVKCSLSDDEIAMTERQITSTPEALVDDCTNECARLNREGIYPCVAFNIRTNAFPQVNRRNSCIFHTCINSDPAFNPGVLSVIMPDACLGTSKPSTSPTQLPSTSPTTNPTDSPTTSQPSTSPTISPTEAPTTGKPSRSPSLRPPTTREPTTDETVMPSSAPSVPTKFPTWPELPPTSFPTVGVTPSPFGFKSPTGIPGSAVFDRSLFNKVELKFNLCMIARPQTGTFTAVFRSFGGSEDDCMKECQYENLCSGVLYSRTLDQCVKVIMMETTDDPARVEDFQENWVAFVKITAPIPYYANFCGQFNGIGTCTAENSEKQCKWGVGERGYNQMRHTDYGYCGRVACNRPTG